MDIYEISYLLRYIPVLLLAGTVLLLLFDSVGELRWDMRRNVNPFGGFSLLAGKTVSAANDNVRSFALYHTTVIGSAPSCDIHIKEINMAKRHAIIYFYDGDWFIRKAAGKHRVLLNGVAIRHPIPLENRDVLQIGGGKFLFLNETDDGSETRVTYQAGESSTAYPKEKIRMKRTFAFLFSNLFTVFTALLLILFIPSEFSRTIKIITVFYCAFFVMSNLYYLLLPRLIKGFDGILLLLLSQLASLGFLLQIRLELFPGVSTTLTVDDLMPRLMSQGISFLIPFALLPIIVLIVAKTYFLEKIWVGCAILTPLLLIVTFIFGRGSEEHGAGLWLSVGGMSIQLTEFAKITYLIVLAAFFKNRASKKNQIIFACWAALVFGLIMLLPDLGSAMILLPTTVLIYVVMTSEYITTLLILVAGSGMGVVAYSLFSHVRRRLEGWTTLWTEVNDNNSQIVYGLQAIGRGGLFGRGIMNGSPGGIPLAASDMVFSILCEELGLIAGFCVVLLFIILWLRSAKITVLSKDGFSSGLALGIGTLFFVQAVVVISGTTGILPLTGATIPLIAKGGSSIMTVVVLMAILMGLSGRKGKVLT